MPDLGKITKAGAKQMFDLAKARTAIYYQKQGGIYDPATDTYTGQAIVPYAVRMIPAHEKIQNDKGNSVIIEVIPKFIILADSAPASLDPSANDDLEFDGTTYNVTGTTRIEVAQDTIAFIVICKNA